MAGDEPGAHQTAPKPANETAAQPVIEQEPQTNPQSLQGQNVANLSAWRQALSASRDFIRGLTGWRRYVFAIAMGAISALAMAPFFFVPALVFCFTAFVWQLDGLDRSRRGLHVAFFLGWAYGFGYFAAGVHWIGNSFLVDKETFGGIMPFAMLGLTAGLGLFGAIAAILAWPFWAKGASRVGVFALAWFFTEWLRGWVFTGFPWNLVGYAWGGVLPVMQVSSLIGIYGLSLLTVLAAASPAILADPGSHQKLVHRRALWLVVPWVLLAAGAVWGTARLADGGPVLTDTHIRIVQPSVPQYDKLFRSNAVPIYQKNMELTRAPGLVDIDLVIWSEGAVPVLMAQQPELLRDIGATLYPGQSLVIGSVRYERGQTDQSDKYYNSLHVIDDTGTITETYDKHHLVPFGEYLPFVKLMERFGLTKLVGGKGSFDAGAEVRTLALSGAPDVGPLICYEAIFPGQVVDPDWRPAWLMNLTDDTWFGNGVGPRQHFVIAQTRAIEEGLPLIRSANNGISAIIDAKGRVLSSLALNKVGSLDGQIPAAGDRTLFSIFKFFAAIFIATIIFSCILTEHINFGYKFSFLKRDQRLPYT